MFLGTVQPLSMIPYTYAAFYHAYSTTPSTYPKKRTRRTPVKDHSGRSTPGRKTAHSRYRPGDHWNLAPVGPANEESYLYRFQNKTSSSCAERDQPSSSKNSSDNHSSCNSSGASKCRHEGTAPHTAKQATSAGQILMAMNSKVADLWSTSGFMPTRRSQGTRRAVASPVGEDISTATSASLVAGLKTQPKDQASKGSSNTCHLVCTTYSDHA